MTTYHPLRELILARMREFLREPEAIFWVYGFPILLMVGLGVAFREQAPEIARVDVVQRQGDFDCKQSLERVRGLEVSIHRIEEARERYRNGKTDLIVEPEGGSFRFLYDATRQGSEVAHLKAEAALQFAAGRRDVIEPRVELITEPGSRYIDWLIPGLLGMGLMSGGMWGLGFVTVEFRMKKLLKRFVATPMRRGHFLFALMFSRLVFLIPETLVLMLVGVLAFGFQIQGSLAAVVLAVLLGAACFAGIGLLCACRAAKIEVISGLMNLVMLPMWILGGNFFSASRFPDVMQPFVQALPLTQLNNLLRALMLEGAPLSTQLLPLGILLAYAVVCFALGLRLFKWK